jgi:L-fuconolactonase
MITRLVDSHVHFWQPEKLHYEWLGDLPALNRPFTSDHLTIASVGLPLEKIVFVQADCDPDQALQEVSWVSDLACNEPRIVGVVAYAPLEQPDAVGYLARLQPYPLIKGVRRLIQSEADDFAAHPYFVRGVNLLPMFNYRFDICIRHTQLPAVIVMVDQCPDVSFVLDHFGKPDIKSGQMQPWAANIRQLAAYPNVKCKLSGLVTEADWERWTRADLQPYIDVVLEHFGPQRVMFGSDWPVSTLAGTYQRWVEVAAASVAHLSADDQDRIFYRNAVDFYGLP